MSFVWSHALSFKKYFVLYKGKWNDLANVFETLGGLRCHAQGSESNLDYLESKHGGIGRYFETCDLRSSDAGVEKCRRVL